VIEIKILKTNYYYILMFLQKKQLRIHGNNDSVSFNQHRYLINEVFIYFVHVEFFFLSILNGDITSP